MSRLSEAQWRTRRVLHEQRVDVLLAGHRARRARGERHVIEDFLFDYYAYRPGQLRRWHPGAGVELVGASLDEFPERVGYRATSDGVIVDVERVSASRAAGLAFIRSLLTATAERPARFGCFGMHEWAMVYGREPSQVRHSSVPLRMSPDEIRRVVDEQGLRCSHADAFRFFTPQARPLNQTQPSRETQIDAEQGGCLHANMDLYKWATKLVPLTSAALVLDCFELARDIRRLDMAASPYDVSTFGQPAVPVETPQGRADYVRAQRRFSVRAADLRGRLLAELDLVGEVAC